ncbi:hypothetical protein [Chitinimonas sp. BJB300]|uniref:hypothetical protein n=1 Tax=Chitinimonas sp. BJB300 TaxID=1559339 RepID=UPI000C103526|nr:hypothetical protein [Chitinimonas sp. BJB300]PHV09828.1 hypothetical protein CSQ89_19495 [Chitinimonas sp. BJB300]TSJ82772.1 hypothetical protein FG002_022000 [Chitinimonas sp. BJB300]
MSKEDFARDAATELARAAPPISVGAYTLAGFTLNEWVTIATFFYVVAQLAFLIYRWRRIPKKVQKEGNSE